MGGVGRRKSLMAKRRAVCIKCGQFKAHALGACPKCGFTPRSDEDTAKALILSKAFDAGEDVVGQSMPELEQIASLLQTDGQYPFDPEEVLRVAAAHRAARAITPRHPLQAGR